MPRGGRLHSSDFCHAQCGSAWDYSAVAADLDGMLRHVVSDVFDENVEADWRDELTTQGVVQVTLTRTLPTGRRVVGITASQTGAFELYIVDTDGTASLFEYEDAHYMEAILRQLALVADAYLSGAGHVQEKRGIFKTKATLRIDVEGNEWVLGRHCGTVYYPVDPSP